MRENIKKLLHVLFFFAVGWTLGWWLFPSRAAAPPGLAVSEAVGSVSPNGYNQNLVHVITLRGHEYLVLIGTTHAGNAMIHAESCACRGRDEKKGGVL